MHEDSKLNHEFTAYGKLILNLGKNDSVSQKTPFIVFFMTISYQSLQYEIQYMYVYIMSMYYLHCQNFYEIQSALHIDK